MSPSLLTSCATRCQSGEQPRYRAAGAAEYLLTRFLRCGRCGFGFVGTAAHGNGDAYRYDTCFGSLKCKEMMRVRDGGLNPRSLLSK
jgi:hypothetical protein